MRSTRKSLILVVDDDDDDRLMTQEAIVTSKVSANVKEICDGEELMDYLLHRGAYQNQPVVLPDLILLDLSMPKKNGHEALAEIKSNPGLRHIPVVVLTTSKEDEDIVRSYNLGVNSFITKPVTFEALVNAMRVLGNYWFDVVELPPRKKSG